MAPLMKKRSILMLSTTQDIRSVIVNGTITITKSCLSKCIHLYVMTNSLLTSIRYRGGKIMNALGLPSLKKRKLDLPIPDNCRAYTKGKMNMKDAKKVCQDQIDR